MVIASLASTGNLAIEQAGNAINMKRQHKYQKKINRFNQELAYELWERTGPTGQMEQLKKAGLNPGLMYGMSGAGAGTTQGGAGAGTGSQSANAQMQLGMGLQLQQQKAMIENTKADTQLKQAEANKTAGVDTQEAQSRIENLKADINNKAVSYALQNLELKIKEATGMENAELANDQLKAGIEKVEADTKIAVTEGKIKEESANALIKQARAAVIEQQLRISLQRGGIIKQGAETTQGGAGAGTGSQSANAQMQLGMGLQLQQQKAMIENTKADTQLKQAEANKTAGVDTQEAQSRIENLKADINNKAVSYALQNLELKIKEATGMENAELANDQLKAGIEKVEADTKIAVTEGKIKEESANALIKQARAAVIEQQLRISLQRGGIIKQGAETQQLRAATGKIADEIVKMYNDMRVANESVNQREIEIKIKEGLAELQKQSTEFNTGWMAEIERGSRIIENSAGAIGKLLPINKLKKCAGKLSNIFKTK